MFSLYGGKFFCLLSLLEFYMNQSFLPWKPSFSSRCFFRNAIFFWLIAFWIVSSAYGESFQIEDGGVPQEFELALDEVEIKGPGRESRLERVSAKDLKSLQQEARKFAALAAQEASLVLYEKGKERDEFSRRILTRSITVQLAAGTDPKATAAKVGATAGEEISYAPGFYIFEVKEPGDGLAAAEMLRAEPGVLYAQPMLEGKRSKYLIPNDPFFGQQWHLRNTGQNGAIPGVDIDVTNVWNSYRGSGVMIGIVDDGLQYTHPDLAANCNTNIDYDYWSNDNNPAPNLATDRHGTCVAGVAAARGNNGIGVAGVAYEATLVGIRLLGGSFTDAQEGSSLSHSNQVIQIKNNSWGLPGDGSSLGGAGPLAAQALQTGATSGRGGKGTIFVWAAGNSWFDYDDANYESHANSIYTIAVGALDDWGGKADYSEPGACLVVSAPSGGEDPLTPNARIQATTTTDLVGANGYNTNSPTGDMANRDYTQHFAGTSSAAPVVSGVVALMLQANPNLGWRDVQEVLIAAAVVNNPGEPGWFVNNGGRGYYFNHNYGAGLVNAERSVLYAQTWRNLGPQVNVFAQNNTPISIPDEDFNGITRSFTFSTNSPNLRVEHVTVTVNITHTFRGDLDITLTSPQGTVSYLAPPRPYDLNDNYSNYKFMSVFHWGEILRGTWTVRVADTSAIDTGTLNSVRLDIFGTAPTSPKLIPELLPNGELKLTVDGHAGRTNIVQVSTDLTSWSDLVTTNWLNGPYDVVDAASPSVAQRFYRVVVP